MDILKRFSICYGGLERYIFDIADWNKKPDLDNDLIIGMMEAIQNVTEEYGDPITFMKHKSGMTVYMFSEFDMTLRFFFSKEVDIDILEFYKRQLAMEIYKIQDVLKTTLINNKATLDHSFQAILVSLINETRVDERIEFQQKRTTQQITFWNQKIDQRGENPGNH